jgi:hypothetical protein
MMLHLPTKPYLIDPRSQALLIVIKYVRVCKSKIFSQPNARAMHVLLLKRSGRLISEEMQQPRQSQHLQMAWQEQQKNIPSNKHEAT